MDKSSGDIAVRFAAPGDQIGLAELMGRFMDHEGLADSRPPSPDDVARWLTAEPMPFEALVAARGSGLIGYLAFYRAFSIFKGAPVLLVENLYVDQAARGLGVGRLLLAAAAREADARGYPRIELHVRAESEGAQGFYQALGLGAAGETVYRIEDEALAALAGLAIAGSGS